MKETIFSKVMVGQMFYSSVYTPDHKTLYRKHSEKRGRRVHGKGTRAFGPKAAVWTNPAWIME